MICNQDHSLWKVAHEIPLGGLEELSSDALVTAYSDESRGPLLGHGGDQEAERLLRECNPRIVPVLVHQIQRSAESLRNIDSVSSQ